MNRHLIVIPCVMGALLIFVVPCVAQFGWSLQPGGTAHDLQSLAMAASSARVYAVGDSGTILFTSDQGISWTQIPTSVSARLNSVSFPNADTGFAAGENGTIVKLSRNSVQLLNSATTADIHGIAAGPDLLNRYAFAVGDSGLVLRTINQGTSWSRMNSGTTRILRSICFVSFGALYVVGDSGTVLKSTNAGTSWIAKTLPVQYRSVDFYSVSASLDTVMIFGASGAMLISTNGGSLWAPPLSGAVAAGLNGSFVAPSVSGFAPGTAWAAGDEGTVVRTNNRGADWISEPTGSVDNLYSVMFVDSLVGLTVGAHGTILRSVTGGLSMPIFSAIPFQLAFGPVLIDSSRTASIVVTNGGVQSLDISSVATDNPRFTISPSSASVGPGEETSFRVRFTPDRESDESGTVTFSDNGFGSPHVVGLAGTGFPVLAASAWIWQNPTPQQNLINGVHFADAKNGIAVGNLGTVMITADAGASWSGTPAVNRTMTPLNAVSHVDQLTVVAVGRSGTIVRSTDGGRTWSNRESGTTDLLNAVSFLDAQHGIVVGEDSLSGHVSVLQSSDGGSTWNHRYVGHSGGLYGVAQVTPDIAVAVGTDVRPGFPVVLDGAIFRTTDGGSHWSKQTVPLFGLTGVHFLNDEIGIAVGGTILRTTDAGLSWTSRYGGPEYFRGLSFPDALNGITAGSNGSVLFTSDGGESWAGRSIGLNGDVRAAALTGPASAVAFGQDGYSPFGRLRMYRTSDAGVEWSELTHSTTLRNLRDISFGSLRQGIAVGDSGTILLTRDVGYHWEKQLGGNLFEKTGNAFRGVAFSTQSNAVVVGDLGTVLRTSDGGVSWSAISSGTDKQLNAVNFADVSNGYAVGILGAILRTGDGGETWTNVSGSTTANLNAVSADGGGHVSAVGDGGTVLFSPDAGETWISRETGFVNNLYGISLHADTMVAAGANGIVLWSADAGDHWQMSTIAPHNLFSLQFTTGSIGMIVGDNGAVFRTADAGINWHPQISGTSQPLYAVSLPDENTAFIAGGFGTILGTTSGGVVSVRAASAPPLPSRFSLSQNYPNPFNPVTHFRFTVANAQFVTLRVYDVLGREAAILVNGTRQPGEYTVEWDASAKPSGVYFCRLTAGPYTATRKLLLIR